MRSAAKPANNELQVRLIALIIELCDVLCRQSQGCKFDVLSQDTSCQEVTDLARTVIEDWHELHEFDPAAFANPVLLRALLNMYSDLVAEYHQAEGLPESGVVIGLLPDFMKITSQ